MVMGAELAGDLVFGVGTISVIENGQEMKCGELQNAVFTFGADEKLMYGGDRRFAVESKLGHRTLVLTSEWARINAGQIKAVLGGAVVNSPTDEPTTQVLTISKDSDVPEIQVRLKNPSDGSDLQVYCPRCKSQGALTLSVVEDDFWIPNLSLSVLYDVTTGVVVQVTLPVSTEPS